MLNQNTSKNYKLRVYYAKKDIAAWISHLELLRSIEYAIRRSSLPFDVSIGFSPHMKISFCPALGVGIESECQIYDIILTKYIDPNVCLDLLKSASSNNLMPYKCEYVDSSSSLGLKSGDNNKYCVLIDMCLNSIKIPKKISFVKKRKNKTVDVCNYLKQKPSIENFGNYSKITFTLWYVDGSTIKPELFFNNLMEYSGYKNYKILKIKKI